MGFFIPAITAASFAFDALGASQDAMAINDRFFAPGGGNSTPGSWRQGSTGEQVSEEVLAAMKKAEEERARQEAQQQQMMIMAGGGFLLLIIILVIKK